MQQNNHIPFIPISASSLFNVASFIISSTLLGLAGNIESTGTDLGTPSLVAPDFTELPRQEDNEGMVALVTGVLELIFLGLG